MVSISLPDGKIKKYESPVTGNQIAKDIAPSLLTYPNWPPQSNGSTSLFLENRNEENKTVYEEVM